MGPVPTLGEGIWIGVELKTPSLSFKKYNLTVIDGNSNGRVNGEHYFMSKTNFGTFIRENELT